MKVTLTDQQIRQLLSEEFPGVKPDDWHFQFETSFYGKINLINVEGEITQKECKNCCRLLCIENPGEFCCQECAWEY